MKAILEAIKALFRKIEAQRTHWEEQGEVVVFPETTVTVDEDDDGYRTLSKEFPQLVAGDKYIVLLNGVRYECVARTWDEEDCTLIGNGTIYGDDNPGNNEPFSCDSYDDGTIDLNVATAGEYTVSILHETTIVHPLDEKYLPDSVNEKISAAQSTAEEALSSAENIRETAENAQAKAVNGNMDQNDDSLPDYVFNRTHYKAAYPAWDTLFGASCFSTKSSFDTSTSQYISDALWYCRRRCCVEIDSKRYYFSAPTFDNGRMVYEVHTHTHTMYFFVNPDRSSPLSYRHDGPSSSVVNFSMVYPYLTYVYHPLEEGYIPDTIARKTDIPDIPTIPTVLPNPHALTFTGAVEGTYDGSAPMTVEIPQGGSGAGLGDFRLIRSVTIPEDPSADTSGVTWLARESGGYWFGFDTDSSGATFDLKELVVICEGVTSAGGDLTWRFNSGATPFYGGGTTIGSYNPTENKAWQWIYFLGAFTQYIGCKNGGANVNNAQANRYMLTDRPISSISSISTYHGNGSAFGLTAGTIYFYGR